MSLLLSESRTGRNPNQEENYGYTFHAKNNEKNIGRSSSDCNGRKLSQESVQVLDKMFPVFVVNSRQTCYDIVLNETWITALYVEEELSVPLQGEEHERPHDESRGHTIAFRMHQTKTLESL